MIRSFINSLEQQEAISQDTGTYLLLIGGQSNVGSNSLDYTGRVDYSEMSAELKAEQTQIKWWNESSFDTSYTQPADAQWGWLNQMFYKYNRDVYTYKYGAGGTKLGEDCGGAIYNRDRFLSNSLNALAAFDLLGLDNTEVIMLWCQGYSDGLTSYCAGNYGTNLSDWFAECRSYFSLPNMRIIYNRLHVNADPSYSDEVRAGQLSVSGGLNKMINADSFEFDGAHYTANGSIGLGNLYYNSI